MMQCCCVPRRFSFLLLPLCAHFKPLSIACLEVISLGRLLNLLHRKSPKRNCSAFLWHFSHIFFSRIFSILARAHTAQHRRYDLPLFSSNWIYFLCFFFLLWIQLGWNTFRQNGQLVYKSNFFLWCASTVGKSMDTLNFDGRMHFWLISSSLHVSMKRTEMWEIDRNTFAGR